jgi:two-component system, sporulation sensor kinase E
MELKSSPYMMTMDEVELLLQKNHSSVIIMDKDGIIRLCNQAFYLLTGYTEEDMVHKSINQFIPKIDDVHFWINDYINRIRPSHLNPDNPIVEIMTRNETSQSTEFSIQKFARTDSKLYMLTLHDLNLCRGHSLFQRFSDSFMRDVNLGVILINTEFRLIDISDMACQVLGFVRDEVLNKSIDQVFDGVPIDHQLVQRNILQGHTVRNHAFSWTSNEVRYELLMDSNLLKDHSGTIVGGYVIFKDVSNLRSLEEQVQRSDRLAMIGQIAAGTAHEIRNPLTSIKGFLQVLNKTFKTKGMDKEFSYTEIMLTEIDRINQLVSEFLLLSKPKNVIFELMDISKVFREILPIIHNEAILHGVVVEYMTEGTLPNVLGDRELFKQVCLNISKNGIEAMTDGGILTIVERVDIEERKVNIDIHDSGPGIPSFLIDKIFDPFFTTKENGTGLGLSVCQRIVLDLGGTIRVSSKGFGTTFTISIPFSES